MSLDKLPTLTRYVSSEVRKRGFRDELVKDHVVAIMTQKAQRTRKCLLWVGNDGEAEGADNDVASPVSFGSKPSQVVLVDLLRVGFPEKTTIGKAQLARLAVASANMAVLTSTPITVRWGSLAASQSEASPVPQAKSRHVFAFAS